MSRKGTKPGATGAPSEPGNAGTFAEREREALGSLPAAPAKGAPDTVKLTNQTWQPPPGKLPPPTWKEAPETVKMEAPPAWRDAKPEDEDAITDIRDLDEAGSPVTGEGSPQVAGEIGTHEDAVRIVSVPPAETDGRPVKLPGMPAPMEPKPPLPAPATARAENSSAPVPEPTSGRQAPPPPRAPQLPPQQPTPPPPRQPTPQPPHSSARQPTPPPGNNRQRAAGGPAMQSPPPGFEPTPVPFRPPKRRIDPTMMIRVHRGPARAIAVTAIVAAAAGLGAGYMLWGFGEREAANQAQAARDDAASEPVASKQAPAPEEDCRVKVHSKPSKALVTLGGTKLGETPLAATVPCKAEELTVTRRRYAPITKKIEPKSGDELALNVELKRPVHEVTLKSKPAGASIHLDGEKVGKTPMSLDVPGFTKTQVVLKKRGYRSQSVTLTAKKKSATVSARLRRRR